MDLAKDPKLLARALADKLCVFVKSIGGSHSLTANFEYMLAFPNYKKLCIRPIGKRGGSENPANSVYLHTLWREYLVAPGRRKANDWRGKVSIGINVRVDNEEDWNKAVQFIRDTWYMTGPSPAWTSNAPRASDSSEPPPRVQCVVNRIIRDTAKAEWVKQQYKNLCQLCPDSLLLPDGTAYAEGHHICPLGEPHNGPDEIENILCLCPNCHVLCDLGAVRLSLDELRLVEAHNIGQKYLNHHNDNIHTAWLSGSKH